MGGCVRDCIYSDWMDGDEMTRLLNLLFGCFHSNPRFPQSGMQRCDCGAWRTYEMGPVKSDAEIGEWITDITILRSAEDIKEAIIAEKKEIEDQTGYND